MPKLAVHLVSWNGGKYIPHLFQSLKNQSYTNWELRILDNNSSDNTTEKIKQAIQNFPVPVSFIENPENIGFAGGHNQLFQKTKGTDNELMLLLNQDMYLAPDCLQNMTTFMYAHDDVAAVSPRLMRWNLDRIEEGIEKTFTDQIDAIGLKVFRNRRVVEWLTRHSWQTSDLAKSGKTELEVFGVSGALPMFCLEALEEVAFADGTFFDSSYHSYKEDVDLAYRLRSRGLKAYVLLDTISYHDRSGAGPKALSDSAAIKNKKQQSAWIKYHSYKNHLMTLYKNEYWQNLILDFLPIKWYEAKKFWWYAIFDRSVLKGLEEIWKHKKELRKRKKEIKSKRKARWKELRTWWT